MRLVALLLDFGRVEERGDDRRRPDADRDAGFHQLVSALVICAVNIVVAVAHGPFSMAFGEGWEAA